MISFRKIALLAIVLAATLVSRSARAQQSWNVAVGGTYGLDYGSNSAPVITGAFQVTLASGFTNYVYCLDRYSEILVPENVTVQATRNPVGATFTNSQTNVGVPTGPGGSNNGWLTGSHGDPAQLWKHITYIYDQYGQQLPGNSVSQAVNSARSFATQLAIWDVLGEFSAGAGNNGALSTDYNTLKSWYGSDIADQFNTIISDNKWQTSSDTAWYLSREPYAGYAGQALITNTPEGSSLLLISFGALPLIGAWSRRSRCN